MVQKKLEKHIGKRIKKNTTQPQNILSISEMIATTTTEATITHEVTTPALEVGNYVTVTGHVGNVTHLAMIKDIQYIELFLLLKLL